MLRREFPGRTRLRRHALFGQLALGTLVFVEIEAHRAQHMRCLGELNIGVFDYLDSIAPRIEKVEKRPGQQLAARGLDPRAHVRTIVDTSPKWRRRSSCGSVTCIMFMNWSPSSIKALPTLLARSLNSKILP